MYSTFHCLHGIKLAIGRTVAYHTSTASRDLARTRPTCLLDRYFPENPLGLDRQNF